MRIAQVAPLTLRVPPEGYGGTERIVSYLTEELVRQGHDVTLFARGDAVTKARLVSPNDGASSPGTLSNLWAYYHVMLERLFQRADAFDCIHFHLGYRHFPLLRRRPLPHVTTIHWHLDIPELVPLFEEFREMPMVSISEAQRAPLPWLNWVGTVPHGIPSDLYRLQDEPEPYLAFLGRIWPPKGVEEAIDIARRAGRRLKMAGVVLDQDRAFFDEVVTPHLDGGTVEYVGEIGDAEKQAFLGNASALLFPSLIDEPFGMVMIEAMACGTPVIAFRRGAVPEVVQEGVTGYIVDGVEEAAQGVEQVQGLNRAVCRRVFEERFSVRRMAEALVDIYRRAAR